MAYSLGLRSADCVDDCADGGVNDYDERIMIPSPVLHEYLIKFSAAERAAQRQVIEQSFFVPSFDIRAAELAAELEGDAELIREIKQTYSVDRGTLRVDAQIIATAIVNGAERIITSNVPHFKRLARGRIEIHEVPEVHEQPLLFGDRQIRMDVPDEPEQ